MKPSEKTSKNTVAQGDKQMEDALNRSEHELKLLASFYYERGLTEQAKEIYKILVNRKKLTDERTSEERS